MSSDPSYGIPHPAEDAVNPSPGTPTLDEELSGVFARMSGLLLADETVETVLGMVTGLAVQTVPGAVGAGVSLMGSDGHRITSAATDDLVKAADSLQYELGEGPCLAAWASRSLQQVDDMTEERRWPRWAGSAHSLGLGAALSAPLMAGDVCLGAIKVYGAHPGAFSDKELRLLGRFAEPAAVLVANAQAHHDARRLSEGLKAALRSRELISIAKGVLMCDRGLDEAGAFALLVSSAEREQKQVLDVARGIVSTTLQRRR